MISRRKLHNLEIECIASNNFFYKKLRTSPKVDPRTSGKKLGKFDPKVWKLLILTGFLNSHQQETPKIPTWKFLLSPRPVIGAIEILFPFACRTWNFSIGQIQIPPSKEALVPFAINRHPIPAWIVKTNIRRRNNKVALMKNLCDICEKHLGIKKGLFQIYKKKKEKEKRG